jgi:hypothetical protein
MTTAETAIYTYVAILTATLMHAAEAAATLSVESTSYVSYVQ